MGVDTCYFAPCIHNNSGSTSFCSDFGQGFAHGSLRAANGYGSAGSHNFTDGKKQIPTNGSSGVETGKILAAESATFKQDHGKRIPHRKHGGGTRGRCEIEWAGFLFDGDIESDVRLTGKMGAEVASHYNDGSA